MNMQCGSNSKLWFEFAEQVTTALHTNSDFSNYSYRESLVSAVLFLQSKQYYTEHIINKETLGFLSFFIIVDTVF